MRHFGIRRFLITLLVYAIIVGMIIVNVLFRLLDEILYPNYRQTTVQKPIFIISSPRSGTTLLHRLMCADRERYAYMSLYHTLIISITFYKLVGLLAWIERPFGRPLQGFFRWLGRLLFRGWRDIHPMGFDRSEEDEGLWFFSFVSPAWSLITPYYKHLHYLSVLDRFPESERHALMMFYANCLQRMQYALGVQKTLLVKSVMSSGRLQSYLEFFPDARIVFIVRDPLKTIPSFISMFSLPWQLYGPKITNDVALYRELGQCAIDFYLHFHAIRPLIPTENLKHVRYHGLTKDPIGTVRSIYTDFDLPWSEAFEAHLMAQVDRIRSYRSRHVYGGVEKYGFTEEEIRSVLAAIFRAYDLPRRP